MIAESFEQLDETYESDLPEDVLKTPGMVCDQEKSFLYGLAKNYYLGNGYIVDAGIFLGASTYCFGKGLLDSKLWQEKFKGIDTPIKSFELGVVNPGMYRFFERHGIDENKVEDGKFVPILRENIQPVIQNVDLTVGDICSQTWDSNKAIEILFLDVIKSEQINEHMLTKFLPSLIPGDGVLIQQDYFIDLLPYLKISQEYLDPYFEFVCEIGPTAAFRLKEEIPAEEIQKAVSMQFPLQEKLALIEQAANRSKQDDRRYLTMLSKVHACLAENDAVTARAELESIAAQFPDQLPENTKFKRLQKAFATADNRISKLENQQAGQSVPAPQRKIEKPVANQSVSTQPASRTDAPPTAFAVAGAAATPKPIANDSAAKSNAKQQDEASAKAPKNKQNQPVFRENEFLETIHSQIDAKNQAAALNTLMEAVPNFGPGSKINLQERLSHLHFLGRLVQRDGGKHGYTKLKTKANTIVRKMSKHGLNGWNSYLDFGSGAHDPVALCLFFYLNGFKKTISNDFLPPRNPVYSAIAMYDILVNMNMFPEQYVLEGIEVSDFLRRLKSIDVAAFEQGDFTAGLESVKKHIDYQVGDLLESEIENDSLSLVSSFAVFEHVMEMDEVLSFLYQKMEPGAFGFHFIDLADHRAYRNDGVFNQFSFLTEEKAAPNLNRLRKSEQEQAFKKAGFEILESSSAQKDIPVGTRQSLIEPWASMSEEDQRSYNLTLCVRKPIN